MYFFAQSVSYVCDISVLKKSVPHSVFHLRYLEAIVGSSKYATYLNFI